MNYTVKFVIIIGIVAVVSFFTASVVIPEKNAVSPSRKKSVSRVFAPPSGAGGIPVVVVDGKPAEKPIMASASGLAPVDHNALAPAGDAAEVPPPVDTKVAAPLDANVALVVAPAPVVAAPVAVKVPPVDTKAAVGDAKSATFSTATEVMAASSAVRVELTGPRSAPPNTMAARLYAELAPKVAPVDTKAAPSPDTKVAPPVAVALAVAAPPAAPGAAMAAPSAGSSVVAPPDTVKKKKIDINAPLGYRLATAAVCAAVENRAPQGVSDKFSKESGAVYYFTHLVGAVDSAAVLHRWYREGKLIQTSILQIRSSNWRTHSKRNLATMDESAGNWRVDVVDMGSGKVLESASFVVE